MSTAETKTCPMCAETIKVAAKVCPFCRRPQGKTDFKRRIEAVVFMLPLPVVLLGGLIWLQFIFGPGRAFEPYREKLVVIPVQLNLSHTSAGDFVSTIGFLRNDSSYPWKNIQLEIQYFDREGNLADTKTETFMNQQLPAGATHAFRIRAQADKLQADYVTQKVFVRGAIDARALR